MSSDFSPRIQQLLLGVVHNVPHAVHQKAVAPLADANIVDVVGDIGEAQIQGHPGGLAPPVSSGAVMVTTQG